MTLTGVDGAKGIIVVVFKGRVTQKQLTEMKQVWTWTGEWKSK